MSFYKRLKEQNTSEVFFNALKAKLQVAQNRLKSDMMARSDTRQRHCMLSKIFIHFKSYIIESSAKLCLVFL